MRFTTTFVWSAAMLASAASAAASVLEPGFLETSVLPSIGGSIFTGMAWATDGSQRLFLTRQDGSVLLMKNGALLSKPFAVDSVFSSSECGLIGIALDPSFARNGFVYLFETISATEQRIVRYTASGDVGVDKQTIVSGLPTRGVNHDGGALGFGPDGKLYWGIGDQGNGSGVDADLTTLAAKLGRANRDGSIPSDNPFIDGAGPHNDYIWARGLRNPFALAFQPGSGALWVDVAGTAYEQIFVVTGGSHAGYDDFENDQPAGFLTPVVAYRTNGSDARAILAGNGAVRSSNLTTFTTTAAHGFRKGARVTIAGVDDASFDTSGSFVLHAPSPTSFTIAQGGSNATSGGGTTTSLSIGGAVTGGDFWSSSALLAHYRGDYFFGDFNSSNLMRVALAADGSVGSVDRFATGTGGSIDVESGPDGALWWLMASGALSRIAAVPATQALVVSPLHVRIDESGRAVVMVRLAQAPAASVGVSAVVAAGSPDVSLFTGGSLSFTPATWATPQAVVLQAASDADSVEDIATLRVSSAGLATEDVGVRVTDAPSTTVAVAALAPTSLELALFGLLLGGGAALALSRRAARSRVSSPDVKSDPSYCRPRT